MNRTGGKSPGRYPPRLDRAFAWHGGVFRAHVACLGGGCDEAKASRRPRLDHGRGSDVSSLRALRKYQYFRRSVCSACVRPDRRETR